jgi:hypothetical protein
MVQGFFLNRIDMLGDEFPIGMCVEDPPSIFPDTTESIFPIGDGTMVIAQETVDLVIFFAFIEQCFFQHLLTRFPPNAILKMDTQRKSYPK